MRCAAAIAGAAVVLCGSVVIPGVTRGVSAQATPPGWILPADAEQKKNPHPVDEKLLAAGLAVYKDKCARCHGPGGLGDGADADPDARAEMDLTNPGRAERNPDGVVFYKVWNGRRRPKMPAFNTELTEDQAWAVVAYTQTLRRAKSGR
jgi:mono/diheme cytochrome c family protein